MNLDKQDTLAKDDEDETNRVRNYIRATNRIKPGQTGVLTHDFSRGQEASSIRWSNGFNRFKYDLAIKTDKSVSPNRITPMTHD